MTAMRGVRTQQVGTSATDPVDSGPSLAGGPLRCSARPARLLLPRARCAAGGPSCLPGRGRCRRRPYGTRSGRARNTAPSRSRAHASHRYRWGRCPTRAASGPGTHPGRDLVLAGRRAVMPPGRGISAHRRTPSQPQAYLCRRGKQAVAVANCAGREKGHRSSFATKSNLILRAPVQRADMVGTLGRQSGCRSPRRNGCSARGCGLTSLRIFAGLVRVAGRAAPCDG